MGLRPCLLLLGPTAVDSVVAAAAAVVDRPDL